MPFLSFSFLWVHHSSRQAANQSDGAATRSKVCACDLPCRLVVAQSGASLSRWSLWVHYSVGRQTASLKEQKLAAKFAHVTFWQAGRGHEWCLLSHAGPCGSIIPLGRQPISPTAPQLEAKFAHVTYLAGWSWLKVVPLSHAGPCGSIICTQADSQSKREETSSKFCACVFLAGWSWP